MWGRLRKLERKKTEEQGEKRKTGRREDVAELDVGS